MEPRYRQKADEAFNDLLNAVVREKGNVAKVTLDFIKTNLSTEEYFDFCQSAGCVWSPEEEIKFLNK